MAKMWPKKLPFDVIENPFRNAEIKVYRKLQKELDDRFVVFYSRPWLGLKPDGEEIDGECDFVVADPGSGILVIEVKGGSIVHDPESETWTSIDRLGLRHRIKNPVQQARSSKYVLLDKLKNSPEGIKRFINIRHCVIFPDSARPGEDLAADMPLEIFCFLDDFEKRFPEWIKSRLKFPIAGNENSTSLGDKGIRSLERILARPFHLRTPLGHIFEENEKEIETLTQQQFHILNLIEEIPRVAVAGSAGTGKTVLAIEQGIRLAEAGMRTFFTCFNRSLAQYVKKRTAERPLLAISGFHKWCCDTIKEAGIELPTCQDEGRLFEEIIPELAIQALDICSEKRFDAVVVDEGQDFLPLWWPVLDSALDKNGKGLLRVFYDDNQKVYGSKTALTGELDAVPVRLGYNLRNTQRIHEICKKYYRGQEVRAIGPVGSEVEWIPVKNETQARSRVIHRVKEMVSREGVSPEDIAVLVLNETEIEIITKLNQKTESGIFTCRCDSPAKNHVVVDTIRRFKGLERLVIVVLANQEMMANTELVYVGLSRARAHLVVVGEERVINRIKRERKEEQASGLNGW